MLIDRINLNQLRVFESVYRLQSMTSASIELHLTQSGISQHIKALETQISQKLFDRLNQKLVPTSAARHLYERTYAGLNEIESGLLDLMSDKNELRGEVNIGMPIEFGNNVLLPLLSQFSKQHEQLKFNLRLDFASSINQMLLTGELDFAFVDEYKMSSPVRVEDIYEETFELCAHKSLLKKNLLSQLSKEDYEAFPYVEYQSGSPILHRWLSTQYPNRHFDLNVRVTVMDVQAIARLIRSGMGAGILPGPIAREIKLSDESFIILPGTNKKVINRIRLARMKEKTLSEPAKKTISYLENELKSHVGVVESSL